VRTPDLCIINSTSHTLSDQHRHLTRLFTAAGLRRRLLPSLSENPTAQEAPGATIDPHSLAVVPPEKPFRSTARRATEIAGPVAEQLPRAQCDRYCTVRSGDA
jgi:hypothetical protein